MKEMQFKRRVLKIDAYGAEMELRYPKAIEHKDYIERLITKADDVGDYEITKDFLETLGMSKSTCDELELPDLNEIVEVLTGQKKS